MYDTCASALSIYHKTRTHARTDILTHTHTHTHLQFVNINTYSSVFTPWFSLAERLVWSTARLILNDDTEA